MANRSTPYGKRYTGWYDNRVNNTYDLYRLGVKIETAASGAKTVTGTLVTSQGITATTGNIVASSGDVRVTSGNVRLGAVSAFATTEPVGAIVMKTGTAPSGAITTSGGIFTDGTTVKKIIADGTVSDVQT